MGPRLFRRGNHTSAAISAYSSSSFNGATSFQTWKYQPVSATFPGRSRLQWGHVFSDVEMRSGGGVADGIPRGFNGATSFQTWKCYGSDREGGGKWRFNGATSFQTWKCLAPHGGGLLSRGFNGATSFQTWKYSQVVSVKFAAGALQWGHVFSDVEMAVGRNLKEPGIFASMGPRLFRRGNGYQFRHVQLRHRASMGPRLFRRGNFELARELEEKIAASMGPRLFRRGNGNDIKYAQGA